MKWITALSALVALSGCAREWKPPDPPPPPRYGSPFELCEAINARQALSASAEERQELVKVLEVFRRDVPIILSGSLSTIDEVNKRAGMTLVQGEIVVLDMAVTVSGKGTRETFLASPFVVFDGARFENAADDVEDRNGKNHRADLVRALFARAKPPPLAAEEARTTAIGGDLKRSTFERRDALQKLSLGAFCHEERGGGGCHALIPLARKEPSAGPDVFGLSLFYAFIEGEKRCSVLEQRQVPLPKGATEDAPLEERLKRLFEGGALELKEGTSM